MAQPQDAQPIEVTDELHSCPECGYEQGFHVAFVRVGDGRQLRIDLICPSCATRYNLDRVI
jgi:predicted RNA-binding Zn-ribbon protein involved in translation (DUF1610 family)